MYEPVKPSSSIRRSVILVEMCVVVLACSVIPMLDVSSSTPVLLVKVEMEAMIHDKEFYK